ncbi:MAG TPA: glycosyltransferase family 4 protein [Ktedonobacterales bacterium]|nr:glycosyltransferase family 4 protein [Ktedonobacterales bacterium]
MRIAQVAPLHVSTPPKRYGGTERVIANLTESLVRMGHDVTLFASGDSHTSARLNAQVPQALGFGAGIDAQAYHIAELREVFRQAHQFDIIHSHLDYLTLPFVRSVSTPTVVTLHGRLDPPEYQRVFRAYPQANLIAISASQRAILPDVNWLATIHHGIDVHSFPYSPLPGKYLVFIGRTAPEKGAEHAIAIAIAAGIPLKIAAKVDPKDRAYFEQRVRPLLDHPLIEFIGEVDEDEKRQLMRDALALLLPIVWAEPFGMVFIESLACGTPVLTRPYGSAPELLVDGVTGFLRRTDEELVAATQQIATLSRAQCRLYAEQHFDRQLMATRYVESYRTALATRQERLRASIVTTLPVRGQPASRGGQWEPITRSVVSLADTATATPRLTGEARPEQLERLEQLEQLEPLGSSEVDGLLETRLE